MTRAQRRGFFGGSLLGMMLTVSCVMTPAPGSYYGKIPRTILVLPPVNETTDLGASDLYLATITTALAEHGYYVPPVALVKEMLLSNGLPLPPQMHGAPLARLSEVFAADAVLYVTIRSWGGTVGGCRVTLGYRLVDTATGREIWSRSATGFKAYGNFDSRSLTEVVLKVLVSTVVAEVVGVPLNLVRQTNYEAITTTDERLFFGPYHPEYPAQQERLLHDGSVED